MKTLKDYEEDIYKCSRCGLCQSVCPVYKVTLNECSVSKAKFNMLNGILKGDLSLNQKVKSYLDLCTGCNACKNFCPSGIDAKEIFIAVKNEYYKNNKLSITEKILNSYFIFKSALLTAGLFFKIYRFFKLYKIAALFYPHFLRFGLLGKRFLLLDTFGQQNYIYKKSNEIKGNIKNKKALYFKGCFNRYINPETYDAVKKILGHSDIELVEKDFECCGVGYLNEGLIDKFKSLVEKNLKLTDCVYDYVLTDCASCQSVLKEYKSFSASDKSVDFSDKTVNVIELIKDMNFVSKKDLKITFHMPCHEENNIVELIKKIENTDYIEAEDYDKCCGFSGKFAIKNSEISREVSRRKAEQFVDTNSDIILTTCPACMLGLRQGLIEYTSQKNKGRKTPEVMNFFVFLAKYCC